MCCCCQNSLENVCKNMMKTTGVLSKISYKRNPILDAAKLPLRPVRSIEEQVWDIARTAQKSFTVRDVRRQVVGEVSYDRARACLDKWYAAGYVARTVDPQVYPPTYLYDVITDCGQQPPLVDNQGQLKKQSTQEIVWRTARILKQFNARQIIASANDGETMLNEKAVRYYLFHLHDAGYITWLNADDNQTLAQYVLTVNTGPKAPEIKRGKKVYDGNLGLIVYDPEVSLPPSHRQEDDASKQKQVEKMRSKQAKKERRHV